MNQTLTVCHAWFFAYPINYGTGMRQGHHCFGVRDLVGDTLQRSFTKSQADRRACLCDRWLDFGAGAYGRRAALDDACLDIPASGPLWIGEASGIRSKSEIDRAFGDSCD